MVWLALFAYLVVGACDGIHQAEDHRLDRHALRVWIRGPLEWAANFQDVILAKYLDGMTQIPN